MLLKVLLSEWFILKTHSETESPLKVTKNAFYFTVKALFVFKIFKFLF